MINSTERIHHVRDRHVTGRVAFAPDRPAFPGNLISPGRRVSGPTIVASHL